MILASIFALLLSQPHIICVQMSTIALRHLGGVREFVGVGTIGIQITPKARLFDEFTVVDLGKTNSQHSLLSRITPDSGGCESCNVKTRLDNFFLALLDDPTYTGYIIVLTTRNERTLSKAQKTALVASADQMKDYVGDVRGIGLSRLKTVVRYKAKGNLFQLWIVDQGARPPQP